MKASDFRKKISNNEFTNATAGYCEGNVQANMLVLPKKYAKAFEEFAKQNAKAIPVLEIIEDGYTSEILAPGANLLNELPSYNIFEDGIHTKTVNNIEEFYREELVFFLVGCSFTFENSLTKAGISLRHVDEKKNVSMYDTNIKLNPVDIFNGSMVVSMRPIKKEKVDTAYEVTSHYPRMHGTPIQVGNPEIIGIQDINNPDYGDKIEIKDDETPLFWPCGVTPENVLRNVKIPFAITHTPGHMFISDKKDEDYYE